MINPPGTLSTDRLILRRPVSNGAGAVFAYATDPDVMLHLRRPPSTDIAQSRAFIERCASVWESSEAYAWAITVNPDPDLVGMIEARPSSNGVELGYVLNRAAWGNGCMTEATGTVVDWALSELDVFRVWAYVNAANAASQQVLEKVGMVREGVLHRWVPHPNVSPEPSDAHMYAKWR